MQGTGADLVKTAMISLHAAFKQWQPTGAAAAEAAGEATEEAVRPHLLVQIHDELLFEVRRALSSHLCSLFLR